MDQREDIPPTATTGNMTTEVPSNNSQNPLNITQQVNNRCNQLSDKDITNAKKLPSFLLSNIQSFGNCQNTDKTTELEAVLNHNNIDVAVLTETWLNDNTKDQISLNNYINFHLIRNNVLRSSGGVSIIVKNDIPVTRLNINVPDHIECLWVSLRPKWLPRKISNIVVAGVYYPGSKSIYAPNQEDIILHLTSTVHQLYKKYANPLFLLMGDFNDLKVDDICDACNLHQIVKVPTRKNAILDLILTNTSNNFYKEPISLPNIGSSDHLCVLYEPILGKVQAPKEKKYIRKFKKSAMIQFGAWITTFDWSTLLNLHDVNEKVDYFNTIMWAMINKFFPLVKVVVTDNEKKWITPKIKDLISQRQKAHVTRNFDKRNHLTRKLRQEIKYAKRNYNKSQTDKFLKNDPKEWHRHISNIINNGKRNNNILNSIPELSQKPLEEMISIINDHFGKICQSYPPVDPNIVIHENPSDPDFELISEFETYKLLKKFSKKSLVPDDFPKQILQEFAFELALPFSDITNCSLKSGIFPEAYKMSEITPIPKEHPPNSLKDLRPISKTPIGGKILEKKLISELEKDTKETLDDPTQYGNTRGSSTSHYLIKLTDQAFKSTDVGHATTAITIDYSKAFDLVDHSTLIKKLIELKVRGKLIKLFISFLSNRSHYTRIDGIKSNLVYITCGVPQGTISGPKLFTILIHGIICDLVSNYKFVDDKTLAHSYYGDATAFLQTVIDLESSKAADDKMVINESKCNTITFNSSRKNTEPQNLSLNGKIIEPCNKVKLLGVIISKDLTWKENTSLICKKVNRKFFILCKLKQFGVSIDDLLTTWKVLLRPITEYAAPLWHSGLSNSETDMLESLQKKALGLILGTIYIDHRRYYKLNGQPVNYETALDHLQLQSLQQRRKELTLKFAIATFKNDIHRGFFEPPASTRTGTRSTNNVQEKSCKGTRYYNSAIPYMSRELNDVNFNTI